MYGLVFRVEVKKPERIRIGPNASGKDANQRLGAVFSTEFMEQFQIFMSMSVPIRCIFHCVVEKVQTLKQIIHRGESAVHMYSQISCSWAVSSSKLMIQWCWETLVRERGTYSNGLCQIAIAHILGGLTNTWSWYLQGITSTTSQKKPWLTPKASDRTGFLRVYDTDFNESYICITFAQIHHTRPRIWMAPNHSAYLSGK